MKKAFRFLNLLGQQWLPSLPEHAGAHEFGIWKTDTALSWLSFRNGLFSVRFLAIYHAVFVKSPISMIIYLFSHLQCSIPDAACAVSIATKEDQMLLRLFLSPNVWYIAYHMLYDRIQNQYLLQCNHSFIEYGKITIKMIWKLSKGDTQQKYTNSLNLINHF